METLYFILLGLVQGLTEFLPVSSSGHLVLLDKIFGVETGNFLFVSIILHVATLVSVVILYYKQIWNLVKRPFSKKTLFVVVATIPTVVVVILFKSFFESSFSGGYLSICFMITAIVLMITHFKTNSKTYNPKREMSYKNSVVVGFVQGLAVLPGISRSGSTISANVLCNVDSQTATEFSFILSIPIIICSLLYEIYSCLYSGSIIFVGSYFNLAVSFVIALISGIFAIKIMKKIAKTKKYYLFSIYLCLLAVIGCFI